MLKLYYAPGACSQAPHIILHETGLAHTVERVDLRAKRTENDRDYLEVNPKGAVPAIELENGEVLTENAVVLQFLGDRSGLGQVLPAMGDFRRYRVLEWVNYITTELHKSFGPLFGPDTPAEMKDYLKATIAKKFDHVEKELGDKPFQLGDHLTLPDASRFLGDVDRSEAQFGGGADRVAGEDVLLVPFRGVGRDRVGGELLRHFLDLALIVGQVELLHGGALASSPPQSRGVPR